MHRLNSYKRRIQPLRVIQYGLGPIGCLCVKALIGDPRFRLVGAIDIAPSKIGKDAAIVSGLKRRSGVTVTGDAARLLRKGTADAVLHTTGSHLPTVAPQIEASVRAGLDVVSSTEELSFPSLRHAALSRGLDRLARRFGARVLGTGVNPGFVMDALPLILATASTGFRSLRVLRRVDAATRREPLQRKVGSGLSPAAFRELARQGRIGHVGLRESLYLLAKGLGLKLHRVTERLDPVIAAKAVRTDYFHVRRGFVRGIHHVCTGESDDGRRLELDLEMSLGAPDPRDEIVIEGEPPLRLVIPGGTAGDTATAAQLINALPRLRGLAAGLKTVLDLPVASGR